MSTPTGWRLALVTAVDAPDCSDMIRAIYSSVVVKYRSLNPLAELHSVVTEPTIHEAIDSVLRAGGANIPAAVVTATTVATVSDEAAAES
jgi:hypothetical protein